MNFKASTTEHRTKGGPPERSVRAEGAAGLQVSLDGELGARKQSRGLALLSRGFLSTRSSTQGKLAVTFQPFRSIQVS